MNRFTIREEDDSEVAPVRFRYSSPSPDSTVFLDFFGIGLLNGPAYPIHLYGSPIRAGPHCLKVARELHRGANLAA